MRDLIDSLRHQKFFVTMYDMGKKRPEFVLAVVVDEPIEIWYVSRAMHDVGVPMMDGRLLYFPEMKINAETYEYICCA